MSNVTMWYARNSDGEIITIDNAIRGGEYFCPICGSELIPKAIKKDAKVSSHFAHFDSSKCSNESVAHWWIKNKLVEPGEKFKIFESKESSNYKEYICKRVEIEKYAKLSSGKRYKPDVTIETQDGSIIYFEIKNTNSKRTIDYIDIWNELKGIVVEVNVKDILNGIRDVFYLLYKDKKCFNSASDTYYKTIGCLKDGTEYNEELVKKLDWIWADVEKYFLDKLEISDIFNLVYSIDHNLKFHVCNILKVPRHKSIIEELLNYRKKTYIDECHRLKYNNFIEDFKDHTHTHRIIYDKLFNSTVDIAIRKYGTTHIFRIKGTEDLEQEIIDYFDYKTFVDGINGIIKFIRDTYKANSVLLNIGYCFVDKNKFTFKFDILSNNRLPKETIIFTYKKDENIILINNDESSLILEELNYKNLKEALSVIAREYRYRV